MADTTDLIPLIERLAAVRVLCIGDVMLDHYIYGQVERVSPEAPIPVLSIERESKTLGGAGNVLRNLVALGARASFISVIGDDEPGREIGRLLAAQEGADIHVLVEPMRPTTVKTRYVAANQQLLRADREIATPLDPVVRASLLRLARKLAGDHTVVILSDYAKGVLAEGVAGEIIGAARAAGIPVVVDPKGDPMRYRGASLLKPNRRELVHAAGMPAVTVDEVVKAAAALIERCGVAAVLASLGRDGMVLVGADGGVYRQYAEVREVYDVSGAGDTVVAMLGAALGAGIAVVDGARLANIAAGIVVGKVGTAVVYPSELAAWIGVRAVPNTDKLMPREHAFEQVERWRRQGLRIGFTNGCFDLLHPGHVSLLRQAKTACDRLVVGLNSDASAARLKGPNRPVQTATARAAVLASLAAVDLIVTFEEDTPLELIRALHPQVLVKGADYRLEEVVGADFVTAAGGEVVLAEIMPGYSTSATLARFSRAARGDLGEISEKVATPALRVEEMAQPGGRSPGET